MDELPDTLPPEAFHAPDTIAPDSPEAKELSQLPSSAADDLPDVLPANAPEVAEMISQKDELEKLPEGDIARRYVEDRKKGIATDPTVYEDAYHKRAIEANWTGSENLNEGAARRSVLDIVKQAASAIYQGTKTHAQEAITGLTGIGSVP